MDLLKTNLVLVSAPLPADFEGSPQELHEAIVKRLEIQSAVGTNFFVIGDVAPSSNQGPWLRGGNKWYVFNGAAGGYIPLDISDSVVPLVTVSITEPPEPQAGDPSIWLRVLAGRAIDLYYWNGLVWRPGGKVTASGPTTERPTTPIDFEQFFDTTINVLLHWERGAWRTVSGTPNDVKFVTSQTLDAALTANPGWNYLGSLDQGFIGCTLAVAAKDPGATPASSFATDTGITPRAAGDVVGAETHVLTSTEIEQHTHLIGGLTHLNSDNNVHFYRVDDGDNFVAPPNMPPNYAQILGQDAPNGTKTGNLPALPTGTMLVTSKQLSLTTAAAYTGAATAHNNMQPTLYLWALTKA